MTVRAAPLVGFSVLVLGFQGVALAQSDISIERGLYVSIIGGCHDCHTEGYRESGGKIDPSKAMKGISSLGWKGPWGVAYASNLRLKAYLRDEDSFVEDLREMTNSLPPMPWYNVRAMQESDLRSLYRYLISLGEPGKPVPLPSAGEEPKTPYITIAPPTVP
jgi:hypothetical protein